MALASPLLLVRQPLALGVDSIFPRSFSGTCIGQRPFKGRARWYVENTEHLAFDGRVEIAPRKGHARSIAKPSGVSRALIVVTQRPALGIIYSQVRSAYRALQQPLAQSATSPG